MSHNDLSLHSLPYDVGKFIASKKMNSQFKEKPYSPFHDTAKIIEYSFNDVVNKVKIHFESMFEKSDTSKAQEQLERQHEAIIGVLRSVSFFKDEITDFLRKNNLLNASYPNYYHNLTDAVFNELFGLGPLATWYDYPDSQAAHIIGTTIFFEIGEKLVKQPVKFESKARVEELVRALTLKDPRSKINEYSPKLEIDMTDGTRVTLFVPPLSRHISITFRRFVVKKISFAQQAEKKTIPHDAIIFFHALNMTRPNIVIAGPVKSGKSTMLSTFYSERDHDHKVVCVEKHPELLLSDNYPGRPLDELSATEEDLLKLFPSILRTDFIYLIVGELRSVEAELCMLGCERGSSGLLTTYHTKYAQNIPSQLARLILDYFPNRRYESELIRVAENIDIVIVMDQLPDKSKRVESITEIRLDPFTLRISAHEIMRYDPRSDDWSYKLDISENLLNKMYKNDPEWTNILIKTLKELANTKPIIGNNVTLANDSKLFYSQTSG